MKKYFSEGQIRKIFLSLVRAPSSGIHRILTGFTAKWKVCRLIQIAQLLIKFSKFEKLLKIIQEKMKW